jgi:hypothetical protein
MEVTKKPIATHLITLCQKLDYIQGEMESSHETAVFLGMPTNFRIDFYSSFGLHS